MSETITRDSIAEAIIRVAMAEVGIREAGGSNRGPRVEEYQRYVDGKASREAWCMGYMQWVVGQVCKMHNVRSPIYPSEHCNTVYSKTPSRYLRDKPAKGLMFIMKSRTSDSGHTGIATGPSKLLVFPTVEGNTNAAGSREGDGVYKKTRMTTGTATMKMRGYIDVSQMVYDAVVGIKAPVIMPVGNKEGDWDQSCDLMVYNAVTPAMIAMPYSRMKKFMPAWDKMTRDQRRQFYVDLLFAIAGPESSHNKMTMFQEPKSMGLDKVTGLPVVSEGLLQLSYQDADRYPGIKFNYRADAALFKADMANKPAGKSSWKAVTNRTILNPHLNAEAGAIIIAKLVESDKYMKEEFADLLGNYWSCMRRYKDGKYRPSFLEICRVLQSKGYKI